MTLELRSPFSSRFSRCLRQAGIGLIVLCLGGLGEQALFGNSMQRAVAEGEDGQPGMDGPSTVDVVLVDHGGAECEAAKRRALEVAPEVLALAAWPLDDQPPDECLPPGARAVAATGDEPLPAAIEVTGFPAVVSVVAYDPGVRPAAPAASPPARRPAGDELPMGDLLVAALDTASLDDVRGGFELSGSNLRFSFGIERAVYINGELVAQTVLNVKDLQALSGTGSGPANLPPEAAGALGIVQNGSGNNIAVQVAPNMAGTIIQNTLNDQKIQNVTTINATVSSMQLMRAMSMQSAIYGGIVGSLRR